MEPKELLAKVEVDKTGFLKRGVKSVGIQRHGHDWEFL